MIGRDDFPNYISAGSNINVTGPGVWTTYATSPPIFVLPPKTGTVVPATDLGMYYLAVASAAAPATVTRSGTDTIQIGGSTQTSFILNPGESVLLTYNGLSWMPIVGAGTSAKYERIATITGATQTLDRSASVWVYTGSATSTWTLPTIANNAGLTYSIKNRGSADIILQRAGSDQLYSTSTVTTVTITAGNSLRVVNDGVFWLTL